MARVRLQPHLTASVESVQWSEWYLDGDGDRAPVGPVLHGWDYNQTIRLGTHPLIDVDALLNSTELTQADLASVALVVTVDCTHTGKRFTSQTPVTEYVAKDEGTQWVEIPAGTVAKDIRLACHLVLVGELPRGGDGFAAYRKASRLAESPITRLDLEGGGSRFPTELVSFTDLRWEAAAWSVQINFEEFEDAFAGAARLLLNSDHPVGRALASMDAPTYDVLGSVLKIDIVRSVLNVAIDLYADHHEINLTPDPDSVGGVVDALCRDHFHSDLAAVTEMRRLDQPRFERSLQSSIGVKGPVP